MATYNEKLPDQVMRQGNVVYVYDWSGKRSYPIRGNTAGVIPIGVSNSTGAINQLKGDASGILGQRVSMIFYPGATSVNNGMVASGTRSSGGTVTTGASADVTYWTPEAIYYPGEIGRIGGQGAASGAYLSGQITVGLDMSSGTVLGKVTARIRTNTSASSADAGGWATCLELTGTISCSTAEQFLTYDMPHLLTSASCESMPLGFQVGVQTAIAASAVIARIMESSYIAFDVIPGT